MNKEIFFHNIKSFIRFKFTLNIICFIKKSKCQKNKITELIILLKSIGWHILIYPSWFSTILHSCNYLCSIMKRFLNTILYLLFRNQYLTSSNELSNLGMESQMWYLSQRCSVSNVNCLTYSCALVIACLRNQTNKVIISFTCEVGQPSLQFS